MLAHGPKDGPQILVIQPLFEEMNRCRPLVAALCRRLAAEGMGCWLPDLPGTGESVRALATVGWADWAAATRAAAAMIHAETGQTPMTVAIRGGALLDGAIDTRHWRLAPTSGRSLLSDLRRSALASGGDPATPAGYAPSTTLIAGLETADPIEGGMVRTVRLASDDRPADRRIEGAPLWRRPEPVQDLAMVTALVDDIVDWTRC